MVKKLLIAFTLLFLLFPVLTQAEDNIVFDNTVEINRWHFYFSYHTFKIDSPDEGIISITKNTPEKKLRKDL